MGRVLTSTEPQGPELVSTTTNRTRQRPLPGLQTPDAVPSDVARRRGGQRPQWSVLPLGEPRVLVGADSEIVTSTQPLRRYRGHGAGFLVQIKEPHRAPQAPEDDPLHGEGLLPPLHIRARFHFYAKSKFHPRLRSRREQYPWHP